MKKTICLLLCALLLLLAGFVFSVIRGGAAGHALGALGLAGMLTAFAGFGYGLRALAHHGRHARLPAAGALVSGLVSIVWLAIFFSGF